MKKKNTILLVVVMLALVLSGCAQDATVDPVEKIGPKVYRTVGSKVTTLNPHIYKTSSENAVLELVSGNLLEFLYIDEEKRGNFVPCHAAGMPTKSEDGKVWTFKLRDNLHFTDGTKIDAYTYEESYKLLLDHNLANYRASSLFDSIIITNAEKYYLNEAEWSEVGIKALDNLTLQITIDVAVADTDFLFTFTNGGSTSPINIELFNKCWLDEEKTENTYGTSAETTSSSGAYKLVDWTRDQFRKFEKVEDYPLADYYIPTSVEQRVVEDTKVRLQLFEAGETDVVGVSGENYEKYAEDPRLLFSPQNSVWNMFINMESKEKPFLGDINFRKALYHALPREQMAKDIFKIYKPAAYVLSPEAIIDYETEKRYRDTDLAKAIEPKNNGMDIEYAKECFNKVYEKYGKMEVEFSYFEGSDNYKSLAELLEQELESIFGSDKLDIYLQATPWQTTYANLRAGKYDLATGGWATNVFDPWGSLIVYTSDFAGKLDQFKNDEFDELYNRCTKGDLIFDTQGKLEALARMEELLLEEIPFVPMFARYGAIMYGDRVHLITKGVFKSGIGFAAMQSEIDPLIEEVTE